MPKALRLMVLMLTLTLLLIPMLQHFPAQAAPALGFTVTPDETDVVTVTTTFTDVVTVTPTGTPSTATPTVSEPPEDPDLAITKRSDPQEARPGEQVSFTLQVTNPGRQAAVDVVVVDDVPPELEILEVTTTQGTATFEGQQVTVQVGTIGPGFVVEIVIHTRVRANVATPLDVENIATARASNVSDREARATVRIVGDRLPVTGQSGNPALKLGVVLGGLLVLFLAGVWESMRVRREHTP